MDPRTNPSTQSDEIDLRELFCTLWNAKWTIVLITLACTIIAAAYAFLATPIYQASARTLPPISSGLAAYNLGSQLTGINIVRTITGYPTPGIERLTADAAYKAFLQRLDSDTVRLQFFNELYLPAHRDTTNTNQIEALWKRLAKNLNVKLPKPGEYAATVSIDGTDPEVIAVWANAYVDLAVNATRQDLLSDLAGEVALRKQAVSDQIATLRKVARQTRDDRIQRVQNALTVAESIDLQVPPAGSPLISVNSGAIGDTGTLLDGSMMYLRGAKALRAELELLNSRENDDAYIAELPDLLKTQALLASIDLNPEKLSVITWDRAATVPEDPVKPKKAASVVLGIIVGLILGVLFSLTRRMFRV